MVKVILLRRQFWLACIVHNQFQQEWVSTTAKSSLLPKGRRYIAFRIREFHWGQGYRVVWLGVLVAKEDSTSTSTCLDPCFS